MTDLPPQFAHQTVLDEQGTLWFADENGEQTGWHLHAGMRVAWLPFDQRNGFILQLLGSRVRDEADRRAFEEEGILVSLMRDELKAVIRQLQAIDAMLEDR